MRFVNKFKNDHLLLKSVICVSVLSMCHWIQFVNSGYMIQPLVRAICATTYVVTAILFGKKSWPIALFVWAMALVYFNRFCNYTSFIMILIAIGRNKSLKFPYIYSYFIAVIVCLYLYKDTYTHLLIHVGGCYFFYNVYLVIMNFVEPNQVPLDLTSEEEDILKQMAEGKEIKSVSGYSQNTIYDKLKSARKRNGCLFNKDLKERYIKEHR